MNKNYQVLMQAMSTISCTWSQLILITLWGRSDHSEDTTAGTRLQGSTMQPLSGTGGPRNNPGTLISSASFSEWTTQTGLPPVSLKGHYWHFGTTKASRTAEVPKTEYSVGQVVCWLLPGKPKIPGDYPRASSTFSQIICTPSPNADVGSEGRL